jgi:hypothetical protein
MTQSVTPLTLRQHQPKAPDGPVLQAEKTSSLCVHTEMSTSSTLLQSPCS